MCTALVSFDPSAPVPVLLVGVRDEFTDRAWEPPAAHWPDRPALIGGRDLLAGGTWLAIDPDVPRVGVVLNGQGYPAPADNRLSRGELPLRAAADGDLGGIDLARLDPFHLIAAEPSKVRLWTWTGEDLVDTWLEPGTHMIVNTGFDGTCVASGGSIPEEGLNGIRARLAHFKPRLAAAERPEPGDGPIAEAWGPWLTLAEGDGLPSDDPRALLIRHETGDRIFGTTSVSLVALSPEGVRYDFSGRPGDPGAWTSVL